MSLKLTTRTDPQLPYKVGHLSLNFSSNPGYIHVFDFEKLDFIWWHQMTVRCVPIYVGIGLLYLLSVLALKKWMEPREGFQLRRGLFLWNVLLSTLSTIVFLRVLPELKHVITTYGLYESYCKQDHVNMATAFWGQVYVYIKILEFGDTWFILLRKQKLTFLHTFHHISVYMACVWGGILFDPAVRHFLVINCFVHIVMYAYFALKAAQVKLPRSFAMAVTSVQLLQFVAGITINCLSLYAVGMGTQPSCERPKQVHILFFLLFIVYFCLFGNFFLESYVRKKDKKVK